MRWFPRKRNWPHKGLAPQRLSQLQRAVLVWLLADAERTKGVAASHQELVHALAHDKGNVSHSLRNLEAKGLVWLTKTPGGHVEAVDLTPEGRKRASTLTGSCG
jgi:DNA-binding MarR family transcriptional regulator